MTAPASAGPKVAVVIVTWNSREDVASCLASLRQVTLPLEVVVVDNASDDGTAAVVREWLPDGLIEAGSNLGFAQACNLGWRKTGAPLVLFLNPDARVEAGAVEALAALLEARPKVGIAGPATRNEDGSPQVSFGPDLYPWTEWRQGLLVKAVKGRDPAALARAEALIAQEAEPDWVSGSCLMTRRAVLQPLGGFDEQFFLYEEDVDLCVRARRAGWRVAFTPAARVVHRLGRSMGQASGRAEAEYARSHLAYYRKHRGRFWTLLLRLWLARKGT
jgi:GT2 family glycosyltransferase